MQPSLNDPPALSHVGFYASPGSSVLERLHVATRPSSGLIAAGRPASSWLHFCVNKTIPESESSLVFYESSFESLETINPAVAHVLSCLNVMDGVEEQWLIVSLGLG